MRATVVCLRDMVSNFVNYNNFRTFLCTPSNIETLSGHKQCFNCCFIVTSSTNPKCFLKFWLRSSSRLAFRTRFSDTFLGVSTWRKSSISMAVRLYHRHPVQSLVSLSFSTSCRLSMSTDFWIILKVYSLLTDVPSKNRHSGSHAFGPTNQRISKSACQSSSKTLI